MVLGDGDADVAVEGVRQGGFVDRRVDGEHSAIWVLERRSRVDDGPVKVAVVADRNGMGRPVHQVSRREVAPLEWPQPHLWADDLGRLILRYAVHKYVPGVAYFDRAADVLALERVRIPVEAWEQVEVGSRREHAGA